MSSLKLDERLEEARQREKFPEQRLGTGLLEPNRGSNSGNRVIMYSTHNKHRMEISNPEAPYYRTGLENEVIHYASSYRKADCTKMIIGKVDKFIEKPGFHYWLIAINQDGPNAGKLDVIERKTYVHNTESYGYDLSTEYLDSLKMGSVILPDDIIKAPANIDKYGNVQEGVNLNVLYSSNLETQEDGFGLSDLAALKMGTSLYHVKRFLINDNDILLNLYGSDTEYKVMPDLGEEIKNGILFGVRRQNNASALFDQTWTMLRNLTITDKKFCMLGTVIDFDIITNTPEQFEVGPNMQYYNQIRGYYANKLRYCGEIVQYIEEYKHAHDGVIHMTRDLAELYVEARNTINHVEYTNNGKTFSGSILTTVVREALPVKEGDKITNRYGGKGVVSKIIPHQLMPVLYDGTKVDVLMNKSTVGGRQNYGQLFEVEANYRSVLVLEHILDQDWTDDEKLLAIADYMAMYSEPLANAFIDMCIRDIQYPNDKKILLDEFTMSGIIKMSLLPISDGITLDTLIAIDKKYDFITPARMKVPIVNSNGKIRYIDSMRPVIVGKQFFIRLKQYAREKFSVIAISTVNIKNENSKSRSAKMYEIPYADTPIRNGSMEMENLGHANKLFPGISTQTLMIYSSSPRGRSAFQEMYFNNPLNINIELDDLAPSRSAEIFEALFTAIGNELYIEKRLKAVPAVPWSIRLQLKPQFDIKIDRDVEIPWKISTTDGTFDNNNSKEPLKLYLDDNGAMHKDKPNDGKDYSPTQFNIAAVPWSIREEAYR